MGNLCNEIGKHNVTIDLNNIEKGLIKLMGFDMDFVENEEQYREDTLSLGYKNEAERVVKEYLKKHKVKTQKEFYKSCKDITNHIFDSTSFYGDTDVEFTKLSPKKFKVRVTFIY